MPVKSISGSGESGVPPEATAALEPADPDFPPPPVAHDHPPSASKRPGMTIRRIKPNPFGAYPHAAGTGPVARSSFARAPTDLYTSDIDTIHHSHGVQAKQ